MFGKLNFIQKLWGITERQREYQGFFLLFSFLVGGTQENSAPLTKQFLRLTTPQPIVSREPPLTCHFSDFPTAPVLLILLERRFISAGRQSARLCILQTKLARRFVCYQDFAAEISREPQQVPSLLTVCMR